MFGWLRKSKVDTNSLLKRVDVLESLITEMQLEIKRIRQELNL